MNQFNGTSSSSQQGVEHHGSENIIGLSLNILELRLQYFQAKPILIPALSDAVGRNIEENKCSKYHDTPKKIDILSLGQTNDIAFGFYCGKFRSGHHRKPLHNHATQTCSSPCHVRNSDLSGSNGINAKIGIHCGKFRSGHH